MNIRERENLYVDYWAQQQTLHPKPPKQPQMYYGYESLMQLQWYDLGITELPLSVRYDSFCKRLNCALERKDKLGISVKEFRAAKGKEE